MGKRAQKSVWAQRAISLAAIALIAMSTFFAWNSRSENTGTLESFANASDSNASTDAAEAEPKLETLPIDGPQPTVSTTIEPETSQTTEDPKSSENTTSAVTSDQVDSIKERDDQPCAADASFKQVFRDSFEGDQVNQKNWLLYKKGGIHSRFDDKRPEAIKVNDGHLLITAKTDEDGKTFSGGMKNSTKQTYGQYRIKVRTEVDPSNSTSGVVLTWPSSENQDRDGENNIYETLHSPGNRKKFYTFIHEPHQPDEASSNGVAQKKFVHQANASVWQIMTLQWTPQCMSISQVPASGGTPNVQKLVETTDDVIADNDHQLTIQLDLFADNLGQGSEIEMEVDWVEIFSYHP